MSDIDLDALQALCDAATPGPWYVDCILDDPIKYLICDVLREGYGNNALNFGEDQETANFVAACRKTVPALIARIRELEATSHLSHSTVTRQHEETQ